MAFGALDGQKNKFPNIKAMIKQNLSSISTYILLIIFGLFLSFIVIEISFFFLNPILLAHVRDVPPTGNPIPPERFSFNYYDNILGYKGIPFAKGQFGRDSFVTHNSQGQRSREISKQRSPNSLRVVIIGDSQAWGYGVNDNQTVSSVLEKLLREKYPDKTPEVINLGVSGYGADQAFLSYILDGAEYNPDFIVYILYGYNDIWESETNQAWGVYKPVFITRQDHPCLANVPVPRVPGWNGKDIATQLVSKYPFLAYSLSETNLFKFLKTRSWNNFLISDDFENKISNLRNVFGCVSTEEFTPKTQFLNGEQLIPFLAKKTQETFNSKQKLLIVGVPPMELMQPENEDPRYDRLLNNLHEMGINTYSILSDLKSIEGSDIRPYFPDHHLSVEGNAALAQRISTLVRID